MLNNWTEYYEDLYNYKIRSDNNLLKKNTMNNNEELLILECEVCDAIQTLKNVKSSGLYNIPSELLKHGGESLIIIFTTLCQEIWKTNAQNHLYKKKWLSKIFKLPNSKSDTTCKQDTSKNNIKPS